MRTRQVRWIFVVALALLLSAAPLAVAAPGDLDPSFDGDGKVITPVVVDNSDYADGVAIDAAGRIVVAGGAYMATNYDFAVARYNPDGSLDTTFDSDGIVTTDFAGGPDWGNGVAIDGDGRIVVVGRTGAFPSINLAIARFNPDGSLDVTFDGDGKVTTNFGVPQNGGDDVVIDASGQIVVAGWAGNWSTDEVDFAVARYNPDGSLDATFDGDGKATTDFGGGADYGRALALDSVGRIVVAGEDGEDFAIARYNTDGSLDATFSGDGKLTTSFFRWATNSVPGVAVDGDNRIVLVGQNQASDTDDFDLALARYMPDGSPDTTFGGGDGQVTTDFAGNDDYGLAVTIDPADRIVVAGRTAGALNLDFAVARYQPDGSLDVAFSDDGKVITDFAGSDDFGRALVLDATERIVVAGYTSAETGANFAVARYLGDPMTPPAHSIYLPLVLR